MEASLNTPPIPGGEPIGFVSNGGSGRYSLEAESTTGFVAWKLADGTTLVSEAAQVSLAASEYVRFWACAGYEDTTPTGRIVYFDCHGNGLGRVDVRALTGLKYLDCSFNKLTELPLDGLAELEALDACNNQLERLDVHHLHQIRILKCANNKLSELDLTGLIVLQFTDYEGKTPF